MGEGATAEVYRALDTRLGRPVALKVLSAERSQTHDRERFLRESRTASLLNHPNLMTVYESGEWGGRLFLACELIDGENLAHRLRSGPLAPDRAVDVACQLLSGLQAAHEAGVVHRDVKPPNVMLRDDGVVKLLDFGLAKSQRELEKLTRTGALLGTPQYMAPEMLAELPEPTPRTDVFAVGAILYEMLTGHQAFTGKTFMEVARSILHSEPPLEDLPEALRPMVARALAKVPADRYPTAHAMHEALTGLSLPPEEPRLPVLCLLPLRSSEAESALADGVTWGLLTRLFEVPGLAIIGSQSSLKRRSELGAVELGHQLGAQLVLEGELLPGSAPFTLWDVARGQPRWTRRLEPRSNDPFLLEDQLADLLIPALTPGSRPPPRSVDLDPDLQKAYHDALHLVLHESSPTELRRAAELLRDLVRRAPHFAKGRARLACTLETLALLGDVSRRADLLAEAQAQAAEALALDPVNLEAHLALGQLACTYPTYDWLTARRLLLRALDLAPQHPEVLSLLAVVETTMGYAESGVQLSRLAVRHDPESVLAYMALSAALASIGQFPEAADAAERCLRVEPDCQLAWAALLLLDHHLGREERARDYYRRVEATDRSTWHPILHASILVFEGLVLQPDRPLAEFLPGPRDPIWFEIHSARLMVSLTAARGEVDRALELLESLLVLNYRNLPGLRNDRMLANLQGNPRFEAICRDLGELLDQDRVCNSSATVPG